MHDPGPRLRSKLLLRLVAPLTFLTFLSSLDRVNVSFAALQMNEDLGLSAEWYGVCVGLFFVGYLPFQFAHTALLRRIGARRWIFTAVLAWGVVATCTAFAQSALQLAVLRILLGIAESGFAPGIVYFMSQWIPPRFRASGIAGSMLAIPISMICGGPLSTWLMSISIGVPGWRFMFFVEGALTIVVALLTPLYFVNEPAEARWLTPDEKRWLAAQLVDSRRRSEDAGAVQAASWRGMLSSRPLWAAAGVWFALMAGAYAIIFWLPQVIKQLSGRSDLQVGVLSALPWIGLGLGMIVNSWHSDRTGERYLHIGLPALLAGATLALGAAFGASALALLSLVLGAFGLGAAQGAYWALPTGFLPPHAAARGIPLINLLGSSAGLLVPPIIGWVRKQSGAFALPVYMLSVILLLGTLCLLVIWRHQARARGGPLVERSPQLNQLPR